MGSCCSSNANIIDNSILSVLLFEDHCNKQQVITSLDLSRHIDYAEYIYHIASNDGKKIDSTTNDEDDEVVLDAIPLYVYSMKQLEVLNLSFQYIREIPDDITLLENIRILRCCENKYILICLVICRIDTISAKIMDLNHLEELDLRNNKLSYIVMLLCDLQCIT